MKNFTRFFATALFCFFALSFTTQAQTYFHGGIYANTTWTLANSPYIITDTVVVFPGDTLTIQPGVVVKFDSTVYMEIRQASLIANGTAALPITFQANSTNAGRYFWNGIYLTMADSLEFNYCIVENSTNGLTGRLNLFNDWHLRNSSFLNNFNPVQLFFNNASHYAIFNSNYLYSAFIFFDSVLFDNNSNIHIGGGQITPVMNSYFISNSFFINSGSVFLYNSNIAFNTKVKNCYLTNNLNVILREEDSILNCSFSKNLQNIIFNTNSCHSNSFIKNGYNQFGNVNSISYCVIDSNTTGVVSTSGIVLTNSILRNNSIGIDLSNAYNYVIKQNKLFNNGIGIWANSSSLDSIYCNKIFNDTLYDFKYSANANTHIGSNDWGDTSIAHIRSKIYDGYTNIASGLVNFLPIDTGQCYLSSCNLVLTPTVTNATCDTCHNGKISVQTSGGGAPYHYTWYTTPLKTTATVSNLKSGTYHFCVTDVRGCAACDTVFVDSFNCAKFKTTTQTVSATCATCNNGKAKIFHSVSNAPYQFVWSTSPIQNTDSATALSYGIHIGCVTDHNNCQSCDTVFIDSTRCKNFAVQLSSVAVSCKTCNDGKAFSHVMAGTAPYVFSWNTSPVTTVDSITHQHFGMYTLHVTDANSCAAVDSVFIDSVNCIGFVIQTFVDSVSCNTCNNGKAYVHAQGGVMPYSYHWNSFPINVSDTIKNQHQGIYQVCVKDNQSCQLCQNVLIDSFNCGNMHVNAFGKNTTCGICTNGAAWAVATGGATPYTYLWNTAQTTDSIKNISIGNYIVAATDLHGCKSVDTIKIDSTICFGFQVASHQINPTCNTCTDGSAWVNVIGGTAPYHYTWYTSPLQNSSSINNLANGKYRLCVTDANTCAVCDTLDLTAACSAQFLLYPDTALLHHYIAVNMASGILPLKYLWSWGDGTTDTARYPNHVYAQAGFYTICLTIVDSINCTNNYCDSFYLMRSKNSMVSISVVPAKHSATGISAPTMNDERLMVYPNPTNEWLIVNGKWLIGNTKIEVTDVLGRIVLTQQINNSTNQQTRLDVSNLTAQIYILKSTDTKGFQRTAKFVKE